MPARSEDELASDAALLPGVRPVGRGDVLSRMWFQPSITVTGMDVPSVANASNTLLPTVSARVSVRVAPGQPATEAAAAVERHLRAHVPFGAALEISEPDAGDGFLVDTQGWAVQEARTAMREGWGNDAVEQGIGGSIPFVSDLAEEFPEAQILVTGVEDPDTGRTARTSPSTSASCTARSRPRRSCWRVSRLAADGAYNRTRSGEPHRPEGDARMSDTITENAPATETPSHGVLLSDAAAAKVASLLEQEGRDDLRLRLAVQPGGCSGLIYQLYFDERLLDGDTTAEFEPGSRSSSTR